MIGVRRMEEGARGEFVPISPEPVVEVVTT